MVFAAACVVAVRCVRALGTFCGVWVFECLELSQCSGFSLSAVAAQEQNTQGDGVEQELVSCAGCRTAGMVAPPAVEWLHHKWKLTSHSCSFILINLLVEELTAYAAPGRALGRG